MKRGYRFLSLGAAAAALAIAGCQSSVPPPRMAAVQLSPVEGDWVDEDGRYTARFAGGAFVSVATDTGNKLAEGTYRHRDAQVVELSYISLITEEPRSANCALVSDNQLNCTDAQNRNFVLLRSGGMS